MFIPTFENTKTVTDLREDALGVLNQVDRTGFAYVMHHSKPRAILMNIEQFQSWQEMLEDRWDEMEALKLSREPKGKGIPLTEVLKKYG